MEGKKLCLWSLLDKPEARKTIRRHTQGYNNNYNNNNNNAYLQKIG
jgi:hypothetical protein